MHPLISPLRGHFQTTFADLNVTMTLWGEGGWGCDVIIDHKYKFKLLLIILVKECDVKGEGGGGGQGVNVIMTFRSAKVVWKCPLSTRDHQTFNLRVVGWGRGNKIVEAGKSVKKIYFI